MEENSSYIRVFLSQGRCKKILSLCFSDITGPWLEGRTTLWVALQATEEDNIRPVWFWAVTFIPPQDKAETDNRANKANGLKQIWGWLGMVKEGVSAPWVIHDETAAGFSFEAEIELSKVFST